MLRSKPQETAFDLYAIFNSPQINQGAIDNELFIIKLIAYPSSGIIKIPISGEAQIQVFDLDGSLIHETSVTSGVHHLDFNHKKSGVYLLKIIEKNHIVHTQKIIFE